MERLRLISKASYFVVTANGKLRQIHPTLIGFVVILVVAGVAFLAGQCFIYNQKLLKEKKRIEAELVQINNAHKKLVSDLDFCEKHKEKISHLLYFNNMDDGKSSGEK